MSALPPNIEFTASNGLKVATDIRGAVSVQWGSPHAGGWTSHDPEETAALQEFFRLHSQDLGPATMPTNGPWQLHAVEGSTTVNVYYDSPAENLLQHMEVPVSALPALGELLRSLPR